MYEYALVIWDLAKYTPDDFQRMTSIGYRIHTIAMSPDSTHARILWERQVQS